MAKKEAALPLRPEPPGVQDIITDIACAKDDDVIFSVLDSKDGGAFTHNLILSLTCIDWILYRGGGGAQWKYVCEAHLVQSM